MSDPVPEGWKFAKLDDVAEERSDRIDNPSKSGFDRFVGLEHLDSGELTVRRWGSTADLLSAMKLFKSGDILIGRRNAYLKRASKVEFDGVCSGDAYVVREKKGKIAEGLLPIILNSDSFWDYTIAHASGTMSKRAKWRDLAEYSFLLPSMEEQRRIATTLWAAEDCIVKGERFIAVAERAKQLLIEELFSKGIGHSEFKEIEGLGLVPKEWKINNFSDLASFKNGVNFDKGNLGRGIKIIGVADFQDYLYPDYERIQEINPEGVVRSEDQLLENDILFVRSNGNPNLIGRNLLIKNLKEKITHSGFTIRARLFDKQKSNPIFYSQFFKTGIIRRLISNQGGGTNISNLSQGILSNILVPIPPLPEQRQIAAILTRCDETIAAARAKVMAAKALKMKMINEMLKVIGGEVLSNFQ